MSVSDGIRGVLRQEIERQGAIPFSRFMEIALYCPKIGYYERSGGRIGQGGDYFTNVSVGSLFGQLLAFQFAEWLGAYRDAQIQLVETGAHDGRLAADILGSLQRQQAEVLRRLEYWVIEPSEERQKWQRRRLEEFAGNVRWFTDVKNVPPVHGVIFSNELLDAMPVRRFGWNAREEKWFEWGVTVAGEEFVWTRLARNTDEVWNDFAENGIHITHQLEAVLPDGFTVEWSPAAAKWWHNAATTLKHGKLITFDYGFLAEEFVAPERLNGTLRAYSDHRVHESLLLNPGEQDITAHVNFTQLQMEGERAGLRTESFESQRVFLTRIAERMWKGQERLRPEQLRQFQTLTHPEHLGERFRVLVQGR